MFQTPTTSRPEADHRTFVQANPASFGSTPSDDFNENAHGLATPTRNRPRDATAYGTEPTQRSWDDHVRFVQNNGSVLP